MHSKALLLNIHISETDADEERLDLLTNKLMNFLSDFDIEHIEKTQGLASSPTGSRGDPITIGAISLAILPAVAPSFISLIQSWLVDRRKVVAEAPNGAKVEFTTDKKYSEEEILLLVEKLSELPSNIDK